MVKNGKDVLNERNRLINNRHKKTPVVKLMTP
ncbi:MAG: hypothetical protein ACJAZB_001684 [Psychrosphaera sp.]|jgi:hypothetical protein